MAPRLLQTQACLFQGIPGPSCIAMVAHSLRIFTLSLHPCPPHTFSAIWDELFRHGPPLKGGIPGGTGAPIESAGLQTPTKLVLFSPVLSGLWSLLVSCVCR